ncbi:MAG: MMPL family transporter [Solirubrobacterales bacterium]
MTRIARFAISKPAPVLIFWAGAFVLSLFFLGDARQNLHETNLQIPGTDSDRAAKVTEREFGGSIGLAILLKAPPDQTKALDREGRLLTDRLQRIEGVHVLSPFAIGGDPILKQPPGQVLLTLQVNRPKEEISNETFPAVEKELDKLQPPVEEEVSGSTPLVRALNEASLESLDQGELIAIPVLIILLLLVFRSPIAALVPLLCGVGVTIIGTAVMAALNHVFELDALALNMLTMIGLALGVDYSLLMVSRFREELARGATVEEAVVEATARAGRTALFAGTALATGMLGALAIAPGNLLISATIGVLVASFLAVTTALFAIPAGLALIGTNVNRWTFWSSKRANPWVVFSERMSSKPGLAILLTLIPLALLSAPALALDTGPPNVANLPPDNDARKSYEAFERDRGAGWAAPYEVVFETKGPITTTKRLRALKKFQLQAATLPGVESVLGPASLLDRAAVLRQLTRQVSEGSGQLTRLERGLRRLLIGGNRLGRGLEQASAGSDQINRGVQGAAPGAHQLASGVEATGQGAQQVKSASARASSGSKQLDDALQTLTDSLRDQDNNADSRLNAPLDSAQSNVQSALRELGSASAEALADPNVVQAKQNVQSALSSLGTLKSNVSDYTTEFDTNAVAAREIARNMGRLTSGLGDLATGSSQLDSGIARTATGAAGLASGVDQLGFGTSSLSSGLMRITNGSAQIGRGLRRLFDSVVAVRETSDRQQRELRRQGTDVGKAATSGFFVLAGIEGAKPQSQTNASFAINSSGGGNTARVIVIPKKGPFDSESAQILPSLERLADKTADDIHGQEIVGGPAVLLKDFDTKTTARFPFLVLTLVLVTFLVLLVLFRAPVLALCAVLLNLVTVGAAVGVLILCFQLNESIFGGPGYLDAIALSGIFAIIFGLSIDYEVFLMSRLIEGRALTGTTEGAIRYGLEKTATIIAGAAAVMTFVFLAFAISPVANTRQFGIGLTVAVVLDATVVRLILLPALIRHFGERTWAVPPWLDRILPRFSTH